MSEYSSMTAHELLAALSSGTCNSEDAVRGIISDIREKDTDLGAYTSVDEEYALEQAATADLARSQGGTGRLLGVPIAIKDILNVKGQACTCASKVLEGYTSTYDAAAIARLRDEGAVFLGRTNMDEFAMGSTTENSGMKTTRNPWNHDYVPGGSSGGSAAAVAGGEAIAALGSDTGGSIRQPASFCGCVGLKPSYGRVSRYGLTAFASSLDQAGPMTKDVRDCALLLGVMAGRDERDSTSLDIPVPDYDNSLKTDLSGVVLGLPREYFAEGVDHEVEAAIRAAVDVCAGLGADIREVSLPHSEYAVATYYIIATAEASANLARFDGVRYGHRAKDSKGIIDMYCRTRAEGFGAEVKRRIILGTYVLSSGYYDAYYVSAQKVRTLIRRDFDEVFKSCHALLAPVAPTPAYPIGSRTEDPLQMYLGDVLTIPASLAGICGLSVPCGKTSAGLPVGLQVLGPAFKEETILHVGHAYESARDGDSHAV